MQLGETIVAISTGHAHAHRGIVRLSGPDALAALATITHNSAAPPPTRGVHTLRLLHPASTQANPLTLAATALVMPGPGSYTGQDTLELLLPGSPPLLEAFVSRIASIDGVRRALPGEFTARALLLGRLTPEQAEGVAAMIAASTQQQHTAAQGLLSGSTGAQYAALADDLASALALVEVGIDFVEEEDIVPIGPADLTARLRAIASTLRELIGAAPSESATSLPRVVLAGPPNAGKSTLFNALLGRPRAVVSDLKGTTRDVITEPWSPTGAHTTGWGAHALDHALLTDLAGLDRAATSTIDTQAQQHALAAIRSADVLIACDPAGEFADLRTLDLPPTTTVLRVRTKADLSAASSPLSVCALDGWGIAPLKRAIADAITSAANNQSEAAAAVLPRHRNALNDTLSAVQEALTVAEAQGNQHALDHAELLGLTLRGALNDLQEVAGEISPDDILGRVFAAFCVGK